MYASLVAGMANYLVKAFGYEPEQVKYGGTDNFWTRFHLDKLTTPGLIFGTSSINFPKGFSAHGVQLLGSTNTSETTGIACRPVLANVAFTLGMLAENENDHFEQIHSYVEMATFNANLKYRVILPGLTVEEEWESTVGDFSELAPAPTGFETDRYDAEGRLYKLEANFLVHTQFLFTEEKKLVRVIHCSAADDKGGTNLVNIGYDSARNVYPKYKG